MNTTDKAQTFTVGLTGQLTGVDVFIFRQSIATEDLIVDVRATAGGVPIENNAAALATVVIPRLSVPTTVGFLHVDLTPFALGVTAGDVLAIVLRTASHGGPEYGWDGQTTDPYPAGGHYFRNPSAGVPTWTLTDPSFDVGFRTFVSIAAVPAVSEWGLAIMALVLLVGARVYFMRHSPVRA